MAAKPHAQISREFRARLKANGQHQLIVALPASGRHARPGRGSSRSKPRGHHSRNLVEGGAEARRTSRLKSEEPRISPRPRLEQLGPIGTSPSHCLPLYRCEFGDPR